jgi:CTD small phosphatase-like protein 2
VSIRVTLQTGEEIDAPVNIRPYTMQCLTEVSQFAEVAVFTASHPCYADAVLDHLDPNGQFIHHRLYRDSCVSIEGVHIKDLRIIKNWDLKDIVIVDNAAYSFGYQIDNGIPIITWTDDKTDMELFNLIEYIKRL